MALVKDYIIKSTGCKDFWVGLPERGPSFSYQMPDGGWRDVWGTNLTLDSVIMFIRGDMRYAQEYVSDYQI